MAKKRAKGKGTFLGSDKQDAIVATKKYSKYFLAGGSDYAEASSSTKDGSSFDLGDGNDLFQTYNDKYDIVTGAAGVDYFFLTSPVQIANAKSDIFIYHKFLTIKDYDPLVDGGIHILYGADGTLDSTNSEIVTPDANGGVAVTTGIKWVYNNSDKTLSYVLWNNDLSGVTEVYPVVRFEAGLDQSALQSGKIHLHSFDSKDAVFGDIARSLGFTVG
jgi:hypothetical protein